MSIVFTIGAGVSVISGPEGTGKPQQDLASALHGARLSFSSAVSNGGGTVSSSVDARVGLNAGSDGFNSKTLETLEPRGVSTQAIAFIQADYGSSAGTAGATFSLAGGSAIGVEAYTSVSANAASDDYFVQAGGNSSFSWTFVVEQPAGAASDPKNGAAFAAAPISYSIEIIPEPSVAVLLPAGALLLALRRNRRTSGQNVA